MGVVSCGTTMLDQGVFNNIGAVTWDTTAKTSGFTAVSGNGYFVNTTSAAITVTLPSSPSAGDIVGIKDYANTADTNNITIGRNGSNIQGTAADFIINTEGRSVVLVYVDGTQGWKVTSASQGNDISNALFVTATGGTITTVGDYKLHTFTGPGTFCISCAGNSSGSESVAVSVIAGGGGGGADNGAGAGGGGMLAASTVPVSVQGYPITVGGGGSSGKTSPFPIVLANPGSNSVFSVFTADGGGYGAQPNPNTAGGPGGSGGGGSRGGATAGGSSTESDAPGFPGSAFGNTGGNGNPEKSGGGGGAGSAGQTAPGPSVGGDGGSGKDVSPFHAGLSGPNFPNSGVYAGGGSASFAPTNPTSGGAGRGYPYPCGPSFNGESGTSNTGGGAGGAGGCGTRNGGTGGSGIVVISYKFQ